MNITISQINNGWITGVAMQLPNGQTQQTATYTPDFDGVIAELQEVNTMMKSSQPPQIIPGSPEDR